MYKNIIFTLGLTAALLGGLTSCADEMTDYDEPMDLYQFDENGIPYRNSQGYYDDGTDGMGASKKDLIDWSLVIGYDWEPVNSYIIQEDGSICSLHESDYREMQINLQYYYLKEKMLSTTYRSRENHLIKIAEYTEQIILATDGSIFADDQSKDNIDNFRLRIIDVMELDGKAVMRAIEPLCIAYYGDDDEGYIIYGETTFQRSNHYE